MNSYYVYIATNIHHSVFYTGVTNNIERRMFEHKNKVYPNSFTARYNVNILIYAEQFSYINDAIFREKQIKDYSREKKLVLIKSTNPNFSNLLDEYYK